MTCLWFLQVIYIFISPQMVDNKQYEKKRKTKIKKVNKNKN